MSHHFDAPQGNVTVSTRQRIELLLLKLYQKHFVAVVVDEAQQSY